MSAAATLHWIVEHFYIFTSLSFISLTVAAFLFLVIDRELQILIAGIIALINTLWAYGVSHYRYNTVGLSHITNLLNAFAYHNYLIVILLSIIGAVFSYFIHEDKLRYAFLAYFIVMVASAIVIWLYADKYHSLYILSDGGSTLMQPGLQYN